MSFLSFGRVKSVAMQTINGSTMPIAVDFGVSALKLLQIASGEPPTLIAAASVETPEALLNDPTKRLLFQMQALPRLVKAGKFKGKRATCAIPAAHMFCKHMQFPRTQDTDLGEMVKIAIPNALETAPDALILRHFAVDGAMTPGSSATGGSGAKQEVICMAASREMVARMMEAIREARLEPVGIHPEPIAAIKAFENINRRATDNHVATLYLDLASGTTKVWITHGSALVFAKTIQFGGRDLDQSVANALGLRLNEARAKRLCASVLCAPARVVAGAGLSEGKISDGRAESQAGATSDAKSGAEALAAQGASTAATAEDRRQGLIPPGLTSNVLTQGEAPISPPEFDLREPLEGLTDEIAMCVRYYEAMFPGRHIDRAVFFGGEARHRGLCQHIAKRVKAPSHVADPLARMARTGKEPCLGVDFTTPQPGWTLAFGLSLCPTDY